MSQLPTFPTFPTFLGYDTLFDRMRRSLEVAKSNWPPYDIIKKDDNTFVIQYALAGLDKGDISVILDGTELVVKGRAEPNDDESYIWKGISRRSFEHRINLADTMEVKTAEFVNGILKVTLANLALITHTVKQIPIKGE